MGAFSPSPWTVLLPSTVVALLVLYPSCVHSLPCQSSSPLGVGGASVQRTKLVCFITASSEHYNYDSLRTGLCSHLILIDLMGVSADGELEQLQTSSRALSRFIRTKQRFREAGDGAKFIVSIGGVAQKSTHFSQALKTAEGRATLSDELVSFSIKHGLDGIDIAWFYPAQFGGVQSDRATLVMFLRDLHLRTKACDDSLSLTVGVDPKDIEQSYDVAGIDKHVDFVNLLTGDYHNPTAASHISPLYGQGPRDQLNINYSVMSFVEAGLNPQKIVIMNSCYAYLYVSQITRNGTTCCSTPKLRTVMRLSYLSARELIIRESFQTSWDDMRQVPYGALATDCTKKWLTYNDAESVRRKAEYVLHHQLGGIGLFSVDEDDFEGRIGCGTYPLLRTMVSVLYPEQDSSDVGPDRPKHPQEEAPIETIVHPHFSGYLTDPMFPEYYYVCRQGENLSSCSKQRCPDGQVFDGVRHVCAQPSHHGGTTASSPADGHYHLEATAQKNAGEGVGAAEAAPGRAGEEHASSWWAQGADTGAEHGGAEETHDGAEKAPSDANGGYVNSQHPPYGDDESNPNQAEDSPDAQGGHVLDLSSDDNAKGRSFIEASPQNTANQDENDSTIRVNDHPDALTRPLEGSRTETGSNQNMVEINGSESLVAVATSPPLMCRHPPPYGAAAATQNFAVLHPVHGDYVDLHQQQPSNLLPRIVHSPSVYRPDAVGSLMPQSSNTVLSQVVISPNGAMLEESTQDKPSATSDAPTVLITPKSSDNRPSTSRRSSRRRSRSRAHPARKEAEEFEPVVSTSDDATEVTTRKQRRSRERKTPKSTRTTSATTTTTTQVITTDDSACQGTASSDSVAANVTLPGETTSAPSMAESGVIVTSTEPTDVTEDHTMPPNELEVASS